MAADRLELWAMAENKTRANDAPVEAYIAARASEAQRADCAALMEMLARLTGEPPLMWGPSIVGYGRYRYVYESGRSGEMCLVGFALRGRETVVYLDAEGEAQQALLARLGSYRMGKSCLYFKRLAELDAGVLQALIAGSIAALRGRHGGPG
ncbi:DUF1801 domain-containing protein [Roseateles violae]|uniref:DUF1801 domain-containing protein n=1 Tax=Roseateles violae TaxID=3058042 RepID=A0ABT8DQZ0_9BURK|nr:DUF1801 domain-containing protein [Pelomonas sp. PFR6]MDN3919498.1 DUF1801 domain-containing protein [Pelomonas sp. PFR6]